MAKEKVTFIESMGMQSFKSVRPLALFVLKLCLFYHFVNEFNTNVYKAIMTGTIEMFINKVVPLLIAVGKFHVSSKTALMIIKS